MKILRYILLGIFSYIAFVVFLFPAAPIVKQLQLNPLKISGVSGSVWSGNAQKVAYGDETELQNMQWSFAPMQLLSAAAGVNVKFNAYGGKAQGLVTQHLGNVTRIKDFNYQVRAKELEVLLPLPLAEFDGNVAVSIVEMVIENQLAKSFQGTINWNNAVLQAPAIAKLGNIIIDVKQIGDKHRIKIDSKGGVILISGNIDVQDNGSFKTDLSINPLPSAPVELTDMLNLAAKRSSDGSYRIRQKGNINQFI